MQKYTDGLVQLIGAATPNVLDQAPMRQASKQLLNVCVVPPRNIIITLLAGCQSSILSSNEWHNDMNPAFISTIMAPNFEIEEITLGTRRNIPDGMVASPLPSRGSPHGDKMGPGYLALPSGGPQ